MPDWYPRAVEALAEGTAGSYFGIFAMKCTQVDKARCVRCYMLCCVSCCVFCYVALVFPLPRGYCCAEFCVSACSRLALDSQSSPSEPRLSVRCVLPPTYPFEPIYPQRTHDQMKRDLDIFRDLFEEALADPNPKRNDAKSRVDRIFRQLTGVGCFFTLYGTRVSLSLIYPSSCALLFLWFCCAFVCAKIRCDAVCVESKGRANGRARTRAAPRDAAQHTILTLVPLCLSAPLYPRIRPAPDIHDLAGAADEEEFVACWSDVLTNDPSKGIGIVARAVALKRCSDRREQHRFPCAVAGLCVLFTLLPLFHVASWRVSCALKPRRRRERT